MRWRSTWLTIVLLGALLAVPEGSSDHAEALEPPILLAAGDVAKCDPDNRAEETAQLIDQFPTATVAVLGDAAYPNGTLKEFIECYGPTWGRHLARTKPAPGNHEYDTRSASGYFDYYGDLAGPDRRGYYSYQLGNWHIVSLNSISRAGLDRDGAQTRWLQADLAAADADCVLAYWHQPRFYSSVRRGSRISAPSSDRKMTRTWRVLQEAGADVVLAAHRHAYERLAPIWINGDGTAESHPDGIRSFVVGTGGDTLSPFTGDDDPHSEVQIDDTWGVLKMTLHPDRYDWEFLDIDGAVRDSGSGGCRSLKPDSGKSPSTTTSTAPSTTTTKPPVSKPAGPPAPAGETPARSGYWMAGADGEVFPFGDARHHGDPSRALPEGVEVVDLEPTPSGSGYWVLDSTGGVRAYGDAVHLGGADGALLATGESVTSLSATPSGGGYWIFTSHGRTLVFGDAPYLGDMSGVALNGPVLDSVPTPSGDGYYMVAADGGIFAFGDARFFGSMGDQPLNASIQSLVPDGDGTGYWLVASDGGVFAFNAPFQGSMGHQPLNQPVTGMVRFADGYLMVAADGGIFNFSSQPFHGSLADRPPAHAVVSVAAFHVRT